MSRKCVECKQEKAISDFSTWKTGGYSGVHRFCRECENYKRRIWAKQNKDKMNKWHKKYLLTHPWARTFYSISIRCGKKKYYFKIKNFLKINDLKYLWLRDNAYLLKRPVIDRIDSKGDYTLKNCRYIEWIENNRRSSLGNKSHMDLVPWNKGKTKKDFPQLSGNKTNH